MLNPGKSTIGDIRVLGKDKGNGEEAAAIPFV
jgi:hypothetical protein